MKNQKTILLVNEDLSYRDLFLDALGAGYKIVETESPEEASHLAALNQPHMIIIDLDSSGTQGVDLCDALKSDSITRDIPIILMTSMIKKEEMITGLQAGASDYMVKPLCLPEVVARIESHLRTKEDYADLEKKDLMVLLELSETISVTRSPNAILRLIVNKMAKLIDVERCSIISLSQDKKIIVKASSDFEHNVEMKVELSKYPEIRKAIESKQSVVIEDVKNNPLMIPVQQYLEDLDLNSIIVIPLIKKENVIGTFFLRTTLSEKKWANDRVYKLSQLVANLAANALENAILFESVKTAQEYFEELSIKDDLTKLYNRRYFYDRLKTEFDRAKRDNLTLSLLFVDLDDFKYVNDNYGHSVGDQVLFDIAKILKDSTRISDLAARWGGDEFAMLLPETDQEGALQFAVRLSNKLKNHQVEGLKNERISTSIGVATFFDRNVEDFEALVKLADDAMYVSKGQGKGQVIQARV